MKSVRILSSLACGFMAFVLFSSAVTNTANAKELLVYFGTFTKKGGKGIYVSRLDLATGKLSAPELAGETTNPGFLAIHPNDKFLYAVGELNPPADKTTSGAVNAFSIDSKTGKLTFLNQQPSSGRGPAHLTVDKSGKCVLVANYGGGSISAIPIQKDGRLGKPTASIQHVGSSVNPQRQKQPYAHSINVDPKNNFAFVADLGMDKVMIYKLDAEKGTLVANDPAFASVTPGAGPRHFAFHPNGKFAYVINEMSCTVTAFSYDAKRGELKSLQSISTLPEGQKVEPGLSTAEVQVHPSGKFLYGSNRGHDSITAFAIDEKTGKLKPIQNESTQGKVPRNFGIDPTGKFLLAANQDSDTVVVFRIDQKTGHLVATGQKLDVPTPVCVKFLAP